MKLHKPLPTERSEALGAEIRAARRHLNERASEDWAPGIGGVLEGLSEELDVLGSGDEDPNDDAHGRLDSIEQRLGEIRTRMNANRDPSA
jgi:hypothetical protein